MELAEVRCIDVGDVKKLQNAAQNHRPSPGEAKLHAGSHIPLLVCCICSHIMIECSVHIGKPGSPVFWLCVDEVFVVEEAGYPSGQDCEEDFSFCVQQGNVSELSDGGGI